MITFYQGDLFTSTAEVLAHGVSTRGIMGRGIAREFHSRFPEMYQDYLQRCQEERLHPGEGYLFRNPIAPHVLNLITQDKGLATVEYLSSAFEWLSQSYSQLGIEVVAMPRIGAGLGGLEWDVVKEIIEHKFDNSKLKIEIWAL